MISTPFKYCLLQLFSLGVSLSCLNAQTFTVTPVNTTFVVNSSTILEGNTTKSLAFKLNAVSRNRTYSIYVQLTSINFTPSSTVISPMPLLVKFNKITNVTTTGYVQNSNISIPMTPVTSTLAQNATATGNSTTAISEYDLILQPLGYNVPPGTYIYNLNFRYVDNSTTINRPMAVTLTVSNVLNLTISPATEASFSIGNSTLITNGQTISNAYTLQVKSNVAWQCRVKSVAATFANSGTSSTANVFTSKLQVIKASPAATVTVSGSDQFLASGSKGNAGVSGNTFTISLKATPGFTMGPGSYTTSLIYTLFTFP
ncbi:MAG: hypothetical protein JWP69_821 [Flaviaesturariibacter sp.]|nr:hypothetical protein [Flaviaesturariibacter sp.]